MLISEEDLALRRVFFQVYKLAQPKNFKQHWQFSSGSKHVGLQIAMCNVIC